MLGLRRNTLLIFLVSSLLLTEGVDKYTDENRPYEFGFNIEGEQHRHEKKDENGLIMGEYGFITADGVYHVTAYATDENGGFRILSMKNIRVKPFPTSGDSARQGHSIPVPQSPQSAPPPPPPAPAQEFVTPPAAPVASCSSCSIPVSTPAPQLNPASVSIQNRPNQNYPQQPQSQNYPQQPESQDYPQQPGSQNYPQQPESQNYPQQSGNQNYPEQPGNQNYPQQPESQSYPQQPGNQNYPQQPEGQNYPQQPGNQNYPQLPNYPESSSGQSSNDVNPQNQFDQSNPQDRFGPDGQSAFGAPNQAVGSSYQEGSPVNQQYDQSPGTPGDRNPKQYVANAEAYDQVGPEKPQLISAQMNIVDGDTDINYLAPGEQSGLPQGITQGDLERIMYVFNYNVGFHGHYEEGYANGNKKGYYYVTGRNGIKTRVDYEADENGFRPTITNEVLNLMSDEVPKPETEKDEKYGLKSYEFKWLYYPVESRR